jgi:2-dehydro-3-deoxyphosphogluconate aldolase / (4S)-4-hydroxy-2-oxoglutarate aldolase
MMTFTKQHIVNVMKETGLVPLLSHDDADIARQAMEAAWRAGVRAFEYTNRKKNSFEVFHHLLKGADTLPGLILGIGTILDTQTTKKYLDAGAQFIISPVMNPEMAPLCMQQGKLWIPGCATLTEMVNARNLGAEVIKVFPGSVLGPGFVSSVMPVIPDLQLMITGGVEPNERSLSAWFQAGAMCVGMGSHLFTREILAQRDWPRLEAVIRHTLEIIRAVRPE